MIKKRYSEEELYEIVTEWLEEYHSASDKYKKAKAKTLIVTRMLPIIKRIARTIARRSSDPVDDLVQAGAIGLLKAIDTYSDDMNDNFKIYASYPNTESQVVEDLEIANLTLTGEQEAHYGDGIYQSLVYLFIALGVIFILDWMVYCYEQYKLR